MIRLVTVQNFASIDTQLENAYRRRTRGRCLYLDALDEDELLVALLGARRRRHQGRDWLRQLRSEMETLASASSRPSARRRAARIRANVEKPTASRKRPAPAKL